MPGGGELRQIRYAIWRACISGICPVLRCTSTCLQVFYASDGKVEIATFRVASLYHKFARQATRGDLSIAVPTVGS